MKFKQELFVIQDEPFEVPVGLYLDLADLVYSFDINVRQLAEMYPDDCEIIQAEDGSFVFAADSEFAFKGILLDCAQNKRYK